MKLNAYAKINLILNVLGTLPNGFHEVEMLMQAISLCDIVTIERNADHILGPGDFEYGEKDLAYRAALAAVERFSPQSITQSIAGDGIELAAGISGVRISIEKHIPAAAGLAGGSADAAAVLIGLAKLWENSATLETLLAIGAQLGSDIPFCIASQLGHPAAIARGTGIELEFVAPTDCGVELFFSDASIPNKTAAVYAELKPEDCAKRYDIKAFLNAKTLEEKKSLMGNHLQAPAQRLIENTKKAQAGSPKNQATQTPLHTCPNPPSDAMLCGAGPTYFTIVENGTYRSIL